MDASAPRAWPRCCRSAPVRGIDAIFASEYKRTQQTATPLSETVALPVNVVASAAWSELPRRITARSSRRVRARGRQRQYGA